MFSFEFKSIGLQPYTPTLPAKFIQPNGDMVSDAESLRQILSPASLTLAPYVSGSRFPAIQAPPATRSTMPRCLSLIEARTPVAHHTVILGSSSVCIYIYIRRVLHTGDSIDCLHAFLPTCTCVCSTTFLKVFESLLLGHLSRRNGSQK